MEGDIATGMTGGTGVGTGGEIWGGLLLLAGGIGLYVYGMGVMTGALKALASERARRVIARLTTSPLTGALAGMVTTTAIQSSSATMLTTIGFVGAGLLTFPQAIGIIYGANVGSTVTGWMVMALGLKLHLGIAALPLMFVAALVGSLASGRLARIGQAAAGFALVFLALDYMQRGTEGFSDLMLFDAMPGDSWWGRAQLLALGIAITLVVQASSAGVAMALVLLGAGTITLPQAAAMVVGMDIGTTFKSLVAAIGGSRDMARTALAHVLYNVVTGIIAFLLVGVGTRALIAATGGDAPAALVAFHTLFNVLGVAVMLPLTPAFARAIMRLVPGRADAFGQPLDRQLLSDAPAALDAATARATAIARALFAALAARTGPEQDHGPLGRLAPGLGAALDDLEGFITTVPVATDPPSAARQSALLHQFDHLQRFAARAGQEARIATLGRAPDLGRPLAALTGALAEAATGDLQQADLRLDRLRALIDRRADRLRGSVLAGAPDPTLFDRTDALRWLARTARHAERIVHYGAIAAGIRPPEGTADRRRAESDED